MQGNVYGAYISTKTQKMDLNGVFSYVALIIMFNVCPIRQVHISFFSVQVRKGIDDYVIRVIEISFFLQ